LTCIAQVLSWIGITDPNLIARVFVAVAALLNFASGLLLFRLVSRQVSTGTAIAAAGAFLFPMGIVWARVWGLENSLYACLLLATINYFHLVHLEAPTKRTAFLLGIMLGLTSLSRLNAGMFAACLLLYWIGTGGHASFAERLRLGLVAGGAAGLLIIPYVLWNDHATGHLLPISGAVKALGTKMFLEERGIESQFSMQFVELLYRDYLQPILWFITSRAADALWVVGGRVLYGDNSQIAARALLSILAGAVLFPLVAGDPKGWILFLRERLGRLSPFIYLLVFGVLNAVISIILYPAQLSYAMTRWWLVENEIVIVLLVSTLIVASVSYLADRGIPPRLHLPLVTAALIGLVAFHTQAMVRHYWHPEVVMYDWNASWNGESYKAAQWLADNVAADERVGSWNAGVLGHYAKQRVTNLDGLINNFELLSYLEGKRVSAYIKKEGITYLSDMESMFSSQRVIGDLKLTQVYSSYSPLMKQDYRIYRVED
jgi:hypothetical protein